MKKFLLLVCVWFINATMNAASIEVKEYLGYMWKAVETVDFGNVATGESTTYYKNNKQLQLVTDGVDITAITVTCSDETLSAKIEGDENYMYLSIVPSQSGAYSQQVTLEADGVDPLVINVTANAESLSFETIAELKEKAVKDGQRYYYIGEAIVSYVEDNMVWAYDATGGVQLSVSDVQDIVPGDVITFSGDVMSASFSWKSFIRAEVSKVDFFNWREPIATVVNNALTDESFGCFVRLPKVTFKKQLSSESYGTTYNDYYFEDEAGNEYHVRSYSINGEFAQYEDFEKNVEYDITGCVWAFSKDSMTAPTPTINITVLRTTEPPLLLTPGTWSCEAEVVIWQGFTQDFELEVIADENDPYRYTFKNFIFDWNSGDSTVTGTVSPDGKKINFYTGQQLDAVSNTQMDKYFSGYDSFDTWNDDPTTPPYSKGNIISADITTNGDEQEFTMDCFIANMQHNLYAIPENPAVEWGTTGGYIEGAVYRNFTPAGINGVIDDENNETKLEYYDLCGRKVNNPQQGGIYIVKKGSKSSKLIL